MDANILTLNGFGKNRDLPPNPCVFEIVENVNDIAMLILRLCKVE